MTEKTLCLHCHRGTPIHPIIHADRVRFMVKIMYCGLLNHNNLLLQGAIRTECPAAAFAAMFAAPDGIELFRQRFDKGRIVGQYPVLEIAPRLTLGSHASTGQIGAAEIGPLAVGNDAFEMDTRTQYPFDPGP